MSSIRPALAGQSEKHEFTTARGPGISGFCQAQSGDEMLRVRSSQRADAAGLLQGTTHSPGLANATAALNPPSSSARFATGPTSTTSAGSSRRPPQQMPASLDEASARLVASLMTGQKATRVDEPLDEPMARLVASLILGDTAQTTFPSPPHVPRPSMTEQDEASDRLIAELLSASSLSEQSDYLADKTPVTDEASAILIQQLLEEDRQPTNQGPNKTRNNMSGAQGQIRHVRTVTGDVRSRGESNATSFGGRPQIGAASFDNGLVVPFLEDTSLQARANTSSHEAVKLSPVTSEPTHNRPAHSFGHSDGQHLQPQKDTPAANHHSHHNTSYHSHSNHSGGGGGHDSGYHSHSADASSWSGGGHGC